MVRTVRKGLLLCVVSLLLPGCPEKCVGACGGGGGGSSTGGGGSTGGSGGSTGGGSPTGGGSTGGGTGTGGAGGGDADAGPPPLSLADFCARYPGLACAHLAACGSYDTSSACLASQSIASTCAQVATGTTVFNGVAARDCLDELSASPLSCYSTFSVCGTLVGFGNQAFAPVFLTRSDLCRGVACDAGACDQSCTGPTCQPWRSPGQSCEEDVKPLARCNRATGFCGSRDGGATVCLPVLTAGEDCTTGTCGPSLHCDFLNGTRCAADLADEAPCVYDPFCASGVCRGTDGKCGALDAGATCRNGSDCGRFDSTQICVGLVVRADGGVTPGACAPRPTLGQACDYGWARSTDSCRSGHGCIDGTCRLLTPFSLALGSECPIRPFGRIELPFYGFASCERGLRCLPSTTAHAPRTGRCGPAITAGGACLDEFNCAAGLSCLNQPDGGVACGALPLRGEPCTTSCRFDSVCVNQGDGGRCGPPVPLDGGCAGFLTCEAGATCDGTTCVATGAPGATCAYDFECSSGACQARVCVAMCIR